MIPTSHKFHIWQLPDVWEPKRFCTQTSLVEKKENHAAFDEFLRNIQDEQPADLNVIENLSVEIEDGIDVVETEDTLTMLETYIDEAKENIKADPDSIKKLIKSLYIEAQEI